MKYTFHKTLNNLQKQAVLKLWNQVYPVELGHKSLEEFETKFFKTINKEWHILLLDNKNNIKGWLVVFNRENERWFAILLNQAIHGNGYGSKLLDLAKENEQKLNGWVIDHNKAVKSDGTFYMSPIAFYLKNDFKILSDIRLELDIISAVKINWQKKGRSTERPLIES